MSTPERRRRNDPRRQSTVGRTRTTRYGENSIADPVPDTIFSSDTTPAAQACDTSASTPTDTACGGGDE